MDLPNWIVNLNVVVLPIITSVAFFLAFVWTFTNWNKGKGVLRLVTRTFSRFCWMVVIFIFVYIAIILICILSTTFFTYVGI